MSAQDERAKWIEERILGAKDWMLPLLRSVAQEAMAFADKEWEEKERAMVEQVERDFKLQADQTRQEDGVGGDVLTPSKTQSSHDAPAPMTSPAKMQ